MQIMDYKIETEVKKLKDEVNIYMESLNKESIWLFIVTLGCWSVSELFISFIALFITIILFSERVFSKRNDSRPFSAVINEIEKSVNNLTDESFKLLINEELSNIKSKIKISNSVKESLIFISCYLFWVITLVNRVLNISY